MVRPREFDIDVVLDAALEAFWRRGYHDTSMSDLLEATGLHKGSLYKAFRDKRHLFITTLERYIDFVLEQWRTTCSSSGSSREAFRTWFHRFVTNERATRGCFAVNTSTELGPHDPEIARMLERFSRRLETSFVRAIEQGQQEGSIGPNVDPKPVAKTFVLMMFGLNVMGKHSRNSPLVVDTITSILD